MENEKMETRMSRRLEDKLEYAKIWNMPHWIEVFSQGDMYEICLKGEKMYARALNYDYQSLTQSQKKLVVDNGFSSVQDRVYDGGEVNELKIVKRIP
jgi:hypothetical protein